MHDQTTNSLDIDLLRALKNKAQYRNMLVEYNMANLEDPGDRSLWDSRYVNLDYDDEVIQTILTDNKKFKPNITILNDSFYRLFNNDTLSIEMNDIASFTSSNSIEFWPNHMHEKSNHILDIDLIMALVGNDQYRNKKIEYNLLRLA